MSIFKDVNGKFKIWVKPTVVVFALVILIVIILAVAGVFSQPFAEHTPGYYNNGNTWDHYDNLDECKQACLDLDECPGITEPLHSNRDDGKVSCYVVKDRNGDFIY